MKKGILRMPVYIEFGIIGIPLFCHRFRSHIRGLLQQFGTKNALLVMLTAEGDVFVIGP